MNTNYGKLSRFLQISPVKNTELLLFSLLVFNFFKTNKNKNILLLGIPEIVNPLIIVPYIFKLGFLNFRRKRYFVRLKNHLVGTFSIVEASNSIHIYSLTVGPQWRKLGIATFILSCLEAQAIRKNKTWLEVSVHKTNNPALRLYTNFGFIKIQESRWFFLFRKLIRKSL